MSDLFVTNGSFCPDNTLDHDDRCLFDTSFSFYVPALSKMFLSTFTNTASGKFDAALFSTKHQLQGKPTKKWPTPAGGFICPFCFRAAVSEWLVWALPVAFWLVRELNFAIADNIFFTNMYLWLCMYNLSNRNVFRQHLLFLKKNNFTRDT